MKLIEDVGLQQVPFRFSYRRCEANHYPGYYHCHQGIELIIVHQGKGQVVLNREVHPIGPGLLIWIQPFQLHRIQAQVAPDMPFERTIVSFEPTVLQGCLQPFPAVRDYFHRLWKQPLDTPFLAADTAQSAYLYALLAHHARSIKPPCTRRDNEPFALLALQLLQYLQSNGFGGGGTGGVKGGGGGYGAASAARATGTERTIRYSERIMEWVEEHYQEPFQLDSLAGELHLSKHYVSRVFSQEIGSSLTAYINARRIRQACWLLTTSGLSVERIGEQVGFDSFSYFCQTFKKTVGVSPNKYRRSQQEME